MLKRRTTWLATVVVVTLAACAGSNQRPDWIDTPQAQYPAASYLTAVGSADDRDTAADRALANLAKIFEVSVADTSLDFSSAHSSGVGEARQVVNEQEVSRRISVEARKVVQGATIAESWQAEDGRVYALATLDKAAAANRFRTAILAADRDVANLVGYASQTADSPIAALHALKRARDQQVQREELNRSLMIVSDGRGVKGRYDLAAVDKLLRDGLAALKVSVSASGESIKAELERALAQLGVQVVADSNLRLAGSLDTAPVESHQGWFWQRGSYELIFRNGSEVLAKQRWPIKVSSTEEGLLASRVRDEINAQLPNKVFELLSAEQ